MGERGNVKIYDKGIMRFEGKAAMGAREIFRLNSQNLPPKRYKFREGNLEG